MDSIRGAFNGSTIITQTNSKVCEDAIRLVVEGSNSTYQTLVHNVTLYGGIVATKGLLQTTAQAYDLTNSCYQGILEGIDVT